MGLLDVSLVDPLLRVFSALTMLDKKIAMQNKMILERRHVVIVTVTSDKIVVLQGDSGVSSYSKEFLPTQRIL